MSFRSMGSRPGGRPRAASARCSPRSCPVRWLRGIRDRDASMISDDLHAEVLAWMADDPDERDRAELAALLREESQPDAQETTGQPADVLSCRFDSRPDLATPS